MNDPIRTPLPDDTWGPDTRRILARQDETPRDDEAYAAQLANALATPAEG